MDVRPYWRIRDREPRHAHREFFLGLAVAVLGWLFVLVCALVGMS